MNHLMETLKPIHCFKSAIVAANEDMWNGNPASDVISLANAGGIIFLIVKNAGAVGTATPTIESCDDVVPTTTTAIPYYYRIMTASDTWSAWSLKAATGQLIPAGADQMVEIFVPSNYLVNDDEFVRMQITETDSTAVDGSMLALLVDVRFGQSVIPSDLD